MKTQLEKLKSIDLSKIHNEALKEQVKKSIAHTEGKESVNETQVKNNEKVIELVKKAFPAAFYGESPSSPAAKKKIQKVMHEFKAGKLKSSSGEIVTDHDQAMAIALSEARKVEEGSSHKRSKKSDKKNDPPVKASKKKKEKHIYTVNGKDISKLSCEELYTAVRESHKKRTASGKKTKPAIEKIVKGVHSAVSAAVKNIPEKNFEKNSKKEIDLVERIAEAATDFLNTVKEAYGSEYDKEEVKKEIYVIEDFVEKLKEKFGHKKEGSILKIARKGFFSIDSLEGKKFPGYTFNQEWNGFAVPFFDKEQADKLANELHGRFIYDPPTSYIFLDDPSKEKPSLNDYTDGPYKASTIETVDGKKRVYSIGGFAWTWHEE